MSEREENQKGEAKGQISFKKNRMVNSAKCSSGVNKVRIERDRWAHSCNRILQAVSMYYYTVRSQGTWIKETSEDSDPGSRALHVLLV